MLRGTIVLTQNLIWSKKDRFDVFLDVINLKGLCILVGQFKMEGMLNCFRGKI